MALGDMPNAQQHAPYTLPADSRAHFVPNENVVRLIRTLSCFADGIAYTFDSAGGLITYTFPAGERPTTRRDELALGFSTGQKDAVLARVTGTSQDYIEMELVSLASFLQPFCPGKSIVKKN
jgi:hypothetical protein